MILWPTNLPVLSESEFILRELTIADAPAMCGYIQNDSDIFEFTVVPENYTVDDSVRAVSRWQTGFADHEVMQWGVVLRNGTLVGQVSLQAINEHDHVAQVGYLMAREYRGRNLMTTAVELVADYAFAIGFRRLEALTAHHNVPSIKVLLKAGFVQEAILQQAMTARTGEQLDAVLFAKLNDFD